MYLFDGRQLRAEQIARDVKRGVASSVRKQQWANAEIYPVASLRLPLTTHQVESLRLLHSDVL